MLTPPNAMSKSEAARNVQRARVGVFGVLLVLLLCSLLLAQSAFGMAGTGSDAASIAKPLRPFVYAMANTGMSYDLMLSNGLGKDRVVTNIKVDGVFFSDASARLSTDGSAAAVRVVGDRSGGSAVLLVDMKSGKQTTVTSTLTTAQGFGTYLWSPGGNTLAFVYSTPSLAPGFSEDAHGDIYIFSMGFQPMRLAGTNGSDRLLAFSSDGQGVYASRKEQMGDVTLEHLVYIPLAGGQAVTLFHSTPLLRYSQFAIWSPPGAPAKVAYLAEGLFISGEPAATATPLKPTATVRPTSAPARKVKAAAAATVSVGSSVTATAQVSRTAQASAFSIVTTIDVRLSRPNKVGLVISDLGGTWPGLLREDAQAYPYMAWTPDGQGLFMGGSRSSGSWMVNMSAEKSAVSTSLYGLRAITWSEDGTQVVMADSPTSRLVTLDSASGKAVATRNLGGFVGGSAKSGSSAPSVKLAVPYIHQVLDVSPYGDGNWACGPTSAAMVMAYYGKLEPWFMYEAREQAASPDLTPGPVPAARSPEQITGADYAPYVTNEYTNNGHTYSARAADPQGNMLAGLYGTICPYGLAEWQMMTAVISNHGLGSRYLEVTWDSVVGALKRGHPVIIGNQLTSEGHILVAIGYTTDGSLIVNDPYGNRFEPGYGGNNGRGVFYAWKDILARRALEVLGTYSPPPSYVPPMAPLPARPATATPAIGIGVQTTTTITVTMTPTQTGLLGGGAGATYTPVVEGTPTGEVVATPSSTSPEFFPTLSISTATPTSEATALPTQAAPTAQPTSDPTSTPHVERPTERPTEQPTFPPTLIPQPEQPTKSPRPLPDDTPVRQPSPPAETVVPVPTPGE